MKTTARSAASSKSSAAAELKLRRELACAFRWAARLNMHEGVANHFSVAVGSSGKQFLMNPAGRHFSQICASELLMLNAGGVPPKGANAPDPTAWCLHAYFHQHVKHARAVLHSHSAYATALASLDNWKMLPIDQNACRFYNRVAYDEHFGGMLLAQEEAARQAQVLERKKVLVMRGHGIMTCAATVAEAFDLMYYFERACRNQYLAMSSGQRLFVIADDIAEKTARQWDQYPAQSAHFKELMSILDQEEPEYRN